MNYGKFTSMKIHSIISVAGAVIGTLSCVHGGSEGGMPENTPNPSLEQDSGGSGGSISRWLENLGDGLHRFDLEVERLDSDDIDISQYVFQYELQQPLWNASLTVGYTDYDVDYQPAIVGMETTLHEQATQLQGEVEVKLSHSVSIDATARHYDGFSGYRSMWIAERFRQSFGFSSIYEEADPKGYSFSVGSTYGYLPGHSVRLSVGYGRDTIAPGYSIGVTGVERSRDTLYRRSSTLRSEDVWTKWLKSEHIVSVSDVSLRETRWSAKSTWHAALSDDWTLRLNGGYTEEGPLFEAIYGGLSVEWNFTGNWHLSVGAEIYSDTGEIPNAGLITTAAPGVDTFQYGMGIRWVGESAACRIYAAIYENDYDALGVNNQFLRNLYQDRNWVLVQASYTYQF